ncbi:MAG: phospho-N-acetylmuramoyl-pentapeptide-transferase [Butyrivibrio sp.]|nr:phospho-N-acetylmuramoyl-pentapeptide-transferase [Butyrivibrio sp.]
MLLSLTDLDSNLLQCLGVFVSFVLTFILTAKLKKYLPQDQGRAFAVDGAKSAGKARGAGIIFILVFAICALLFTDITLEYVIYIVLVTAEMVTGYLDDRSDKPWGELIKGVLDFVIALIASITYVYFNGTIVFLSFIGASIEIPAVLFVILSVILIWTAINVTNCSDGVDGLSASLVIATLSGFYFIAEVLNNSDIFFNEQIPVFVAALLAYLWFNANPSTALMGDAGSRAMGIFIAIAALESGSPLLYIPLSIVLILDGGLGLVKVSLIRLFKIYILKNIRTPLHDQTRKNMGWSNTQVVFRFTILQIVVCLMTYYLVLL